MALTLTIAGVSKFMQMGSLDLSMTANGRGRAAFSVLSLDASYRPALGAEVLITENATLIFGGLVDIVRERGASDKGAAIITEITAVDFNAYADRRLVSVAIPAGNLKAALVALDPWYNPSYGITLHASQVNGPSLPLLGYTLKYLSEIFNDLAKLTADAGEPFVWNIDENKVLRMSQPSTVAAPFDVIGTSLPITEVVGDIIIESKRGSTYANRFVIYMPPTAQANHVETFTGDGTTAAFTLQYVLYGHRGYVTNNGVFETLSIGGGGTWDYDPVTNTITRLTAPAAAAVITITFDGTFSALASAEDAGEIAAVDLWEKFLIVDSIPSGTTAQAMADAALATAVHVGQTATYPTLEPGLLPGQSQTFNVPRRNVNTTAMVSNVVLRDIGKAVIKRDVTVVLDNSQTNLGRQFQDVYKRWNNIGSGGGGVASPVTVGPGTPPGTGGTYSSVDVVKLAIETVNNSSTLQNDDHLFFYGLANSRYWVELVILFQAANTTPNFKMGWTVPSGTTGLWGSIAGTVNYWGTTGTGIGNTPLISLATTLSFGGTGDGNQHAATFHAMVTTSGTPGTVQMQWAQDAATAVDCSFHIGSFLTYRKIA